MRDPYAVTNTVPCAPQDLSPNYSESLPYTESTNVDNSTSYDNAGYVASEEEGDTVSERFTNTVVPQRLESTVQADIVQENTVVGDTVEDSASRYSADNGHVDTGAESNTESNTVTEPIGGSHGSNDTIYTVSNDTANFDPEQGSDSNETV